MKTKRLITFPDPVTGEMVRGYQDGNGNLVRMDAEENPSGGEERKRSRGITNVTVSMSTEEAEELRRFCRWYSYTEGRTITMSSLVRSLILENYRNHPDFRK